MKGKERKKERERKKQTEREERKRISTTRETSLAGLCPAGQINECMRMN